MVIEMPNYMFPLAYLFWQLLLRNDLASELFGIIAGHMFYFFDDVLPQLAPFRGFRLFRTPKFVYSCFLFIVLLS